MSSKNKKTTPENVKPASRNKMLLSGILILAAGIVLLICHDTINRKGFVVVCGILFIVAGIINMFLFHGKVDEDTGRNTVSGFSRGLGILVSIASIVLGISMLLFGPTFEVLVDPLFGILIGFAALAQLYIIMIGSRPIKLPVWTYIFPAALAILAIVIFTAGLADSSLMIIMGIGLIIFGVGGFVESLMVGAGNRAIIQFESQKNQDKNNSGRDIEDIDPEDVKSIKGLDD
ncbi:MAG: hypothetical protein J6C44_04645 [Muribaculaceae bacterium]|nr:hypothetical protein [Muribaculaceae bacterium]